MTRHQLNSKTIWITGVTASGKTTIGEALHKRLLQEYSPEQIEFLDGDKLREQLKRGYGHTIEERFASLKDLVRVAKEHYDQEKIVIVSTISYKNEMRTFARSQMPHFMEVYLECSIEVCAQRDYKDHYRRAFSGEYQTFIGVTDEYEVPDSPELILNTGILSAEVCSETLYEHAKVFLTV